MAPFNGANFGSKGQVISCRLENKVGSRFETNRELLPEIIGPICTPNDYLNTSSDDVVSLRGSYRSNTRLRSPRRKFFVAILSLSVKSFLLIQERRKEFTICWSPRQHMKLLVNKRSLIFPEVTPTVDLGQNIRKNCSFSFRYLFVWRFMTSYLRNSKITRLTHIFFLCFVVGCWKKSTDFGDYFWQVECFLEGPQGLKIDRMGKTGA